MRTRWLRYLLSILLVAQLACAAADKSKDKSKDKDKDKPKPAETKGDDNPNWRDHVTPGAAVTIRLKHAVGKSFIYHGSLERAQESDASYRETDEFFVNVLCTDHADGFDLLALWRTFTDRKRTERLPNGKTAAPVLPNTDDLINLGPNFSIVGSLRCFRYDDCNRLAYRSQQCVTLTDKSKLYGTVLSQDDKKYTFLTSTDKIEIENKDIDNVKVIPYPHICLNETPHYMFPIFSTRAVAPGETWKFKVPVIIPVEQSNGQVLPSQFDISYTGRLREVKGGVAVVDYQISGVFDSNDPEYAERFPPNFAAGNRVVHRVSGDGVCSVDIEKGRILDKSESFRFSLLGHATIDPGDGKEQKELENKADVTSRYDLKLVPPGTKLKSGAIVPEYDDK
jgi:hypothetical protein